MKSNKKITYSNISEPNSEDFTDISFYNENENITFYYSVEFYPSISNNANYIESA